VTSLLDAFFPTPAKGDRISPTRIKSESSFLDSLRKIVPIKVGFGLSNTLVPISDAPNALGYIFSVANPPSTGSPTFDSYSLKGRILLMKRSRMDEGRRPSLSISLVRNLNPHNKKGSFS
jgi:hypothetical protein